MTANRLELVGLSVLVLIAATTTSPAQNTGNALLSGNTTNPVLSGQFDGPAGTVRAHCFAVASEFGASDQCDKWNKSADGHAVLRTGLVVGERRGRPARHNGAATKRGLGEPAIADIPERIRTGKHFGCVLTDVGAATASSF
jgi:hypothetical protein